MATNGRIFRERAIDRGHRPIAFLPQRRAGPEDGFRP
jgi:hypothetical protein